MPTTSLCKFAPSLPVLACLATPKQATRYVVLWVAPTGHEDQQIFPTYQGAVAFSRFLDRACFPYVLELS